MDIKKDVYAMECRPVPKEIDEVYPAVMEALRNEGFGTKWDGQCDEWAAAAFYSIGIAHGVRKERRRRKRLMSDLVADGV